MSEKFDLPTLYKVVESINAQILHQYNAIAEAREDKRELYRGELFGLRTAASRVVSLILDAGGKEPKVE